MFTALIGDKAWVDGNRQKVDALLDSLREATAALRPEERREGAAHRHGDYPVRRQYAQKSLEYMREKAVFARDLEIPAAAFNKTIELMAKANLLDGSARDKARAVLDNQASGNLLRRSGLGPDGNGPSIR